MTLVLVALALMVIGQIPELTGMVEDALQVLIIVGGACCVILVLLGPFLLGHDLLRDTTEKVNTVAIKLSPPIPRKEIREVLEKYCPYYKDLNESLKALFIERIGLFISTKRFIGREFKLNNQIVILIASCGVQITFGLKSFQILSFRRIIIHPETYYSNIRQAFHKGEVNVRDRLIMLSATNFLSGIGDTEDGINLGIHEFTHALNIDKLMVKNDKAFIARLREWEYLAEREMQIIRAQEKEHHDHLFRRYASSNIQEMLAVGTEVFFEQSELFFERHPELYASMSKLYKQDPRNRTSPIR